MARAKTWTCIYMAVVKVNIYWTRMQLILKLSYILILWVKLFQKRFINICVPTAMIILFPPCWCVWCVEFLLQSALKIIESPFLQRKKHSFYKLFPIFFQKKTHFLLLVCETTQWECIVSLNSSWAASTPDSNWEVLQNSIDCRSA